MRLGGAGGGAAHGGRCRAAERCSGLALAALLLAGSAACGDPRASGATPVRQARADTTVDSALVRAAAETSRLQSLCRSDSAQARMTAAAFAPRPPADSLSDSLRRDSVLRAEERDSAARDSAARARVEAARATSGRARAGKTRRVAHRARPAGPPPGPPVNPLDTTQWLGSVARRAARQGPLPGSLLPGCLVVAYYGNPLSRRMGILGEIQPDSMMARLVRQAAAYARVDSTVHVLPALELIATVAQGGPGRDAKYRLRMPDTLIDRVASWAEQRGWLLILDVQVGHSNVAAEIARLSPFLRRPLVHLALDPEFAMKGGKVPGKVIGTLDASEVNVAVDTLARLVEQYHLPPKMLIVHRFTRPMLTNRTNIRLDPRVQVVIDMDGFGAPHLKHSSWRHYVEDEPVQYTGFKLFYKNDKPMLSPAQVLELRPVPVFVMYQ